MSVYFKRLIAWILIPAGLVLMFLPLKTCRRTYLEQEFVFLTAGPAAAEDNILSRFMELTRERLRPYPNVLDVILERKKEADNYSSFSRISDEALSFESSDTKDSQIDKDLNRRRKSIADTENEIDKIRQTGFAAKQELWDMEPTDIPLGEWEQMKKSLLPPGSGEKSFVFENTLFRGVMRHGSGYVKIPVAGLARGRVMAGVVFILAGLILLAGVYRKKQGIMIAKRWSVLIWDVITISVSVFFIYGAMDLVFMKLFGTQMQTEEFLQFMGVFWVVAAIPLVALFISASSAQAVTINEKGVYLDGLKAKRFIPWNELQDITVSEINSIKKVGGINAPKQVMKIMRISGADTSITLMEPPLKTTKKRILEAMLAYAPQEWKQIIEREGKAWQAYF